MKTNSKLKKIKVYYATQERLRKKAIDHGVNLIAPETIFLSNDTKFGKNVTINPYVVIGKKVKIGNNVVILSFSHIEGAKIENKVTIGPYARLRPGTHLMNGVKIGNFVVAENGRISESYDEKKLKEYMQWGSINIEVNLKLGNDSFTCYTCDFTHDYININADYRN